MMSQFVSWWNSADWSEFAIGLTLAMAVISAVALLVSLFVERSNDSRFQRDVRYASSTVRVFRIDGPRNSVRYFNLSDMRHPRVITLEEFYHSFPRKDQRRVRGWIALMLDGKQTSSYLQTDVIFHKTTRVAPSFLRVTKSDPTKGIIHLESYLLQFREAGKNLGVAPLSTEGDFARLIRENGVSTGATFCFTLEPKGIRSFDKTSEEKSEHGVSFRFQAAIAPYVRENQCLIQASDNEFIVANFDMTDPTEAINYALRVINGVNSIFTKMSRSGKDSFYEVRAGIVINKDLLGDPDAILSEVRKAAADSFAQSAALSFYHKGNEEYSFSDVGTYRSEVDRIIYEKKIIYTFRPVYCLSKRSVFGYLAHSVPFNCSFASIDELKNYAVRAKADKTLFGALAKGIVPRFVAERRNKAEKLFYPSRVSEMSIIVPCFSHFPSSKTANLVFLFQESDILASLEPLGTAAVLSSLNEIKAAGFETAILLGGKSLLLDDNFLSRFNAFFIDFSSSQDGTGMDTKIRSELHALVGKLTKFSHPIVANDLVDWNAIELVAESGIDFISSDIFAPYGDMLLPVNEKSEERLIALTERK